MIWIKKLKKLLGEKIGRIQKGNVRETALEITPFLIGLLDPEIITNRLSVVVKMGQGIASYFLTKFASEYKEKCAKGELRRGDFATEKPALILTDLLRIIDEGKIDEERFKAMKSIFYMAMEQNANQEQEEMAYRFFQIAKQLSAEEVLILSANYGIVKETIKLGPEIEWKAIKRISAWAQIIAKQNGHNLIEIVLQYEDHLIGLKLISGRHYPIDTTRITDSFESTPYFRLTPLGYKLCEFFTKYA